MTASAFTDTFLYFVQNFAQAGLDLVHDAQLSLPLRMEFHCNSFNWVAIYRCLHSTHFVCIDANTSYGMSYFN